MSRTTRRGLFGAAALLAAAPSTLAGMLAKARAAKAEALDLGGRDNPEGTPGQRWAWDLMNDLLAGKAGPAL